MITSEHLTSFRAQFEAVVHDINSIFLFSDDGFLVIQLSFHEEEVLRSSLVGGLVAAIRVFSEADRPPSEESDEDDFKLRTILLTNGRYVFTNFKGFIFVSSISKSVKDEEIIPFLEFFLAFLSSNIEAEAEPNLEVALQMGGIAHTIYILLQAVMNILTPDQNYKLEAFGIDLPEEMPEYTDELEETEEATTPLEEEIAETIALRSETLNPEVQQGLESLLGRFVNAFKDIQELTLVFSLTEGVDVISKSNLSEEVHDEVLNILSDVPEAVEEVLESEYDERFIDLGDKFIIFEGVEGGSFVYVVVNDERSIVIVQPILERVCRSINTILESNQ
ncbi:MAG: hypothetical protein KAR35_03890 [Candidatus Heimdallarchaeota archaeon]|nr:hypothetical protein [Candidatus Heimdallarchaeota archaeon]MCK5048496.1 hypothetical protein [Candidatus Heimdallarchaeota archaeon]